jgi:hypothetical protein
MAQPGVRGEMSDSKNRLPAEARSAEVEQFLENLKKAPPAHPGDEQSAEQLQEVDHPEARIAHRGICASSDTIFGSHRCIEGQKSLRLSD